MLVIPDHSRLTITECGRRFTVVAVADTDKDANRHMLANPSHAVIAERSGMIVMADKNDRGQPVGEGRA